jgi:rhodanese-related sulfurtransferase
MELNIFRLAEMIDKRLGRLEKKIEEIDEKIEFSNAVLRNHLIRIKNNEDISDEMVLKGSPYNDLSPQKAMEILANNQIDYIVLDVSSKDSQETKRPKGSIHIPIEELKERYSELSSRTVPLLILSETGVNSIKACEFLINKGYFNLNNISGGYQFLDLDQDDPATETLEQS